MAYSLCSPFREVALTCSGDRLCTWYSVVLLYFSGIRQRSVLFSSQSFVWKWSDSLLSRVELSIIESCTDLDFQQQSESDRIGLNDIVGQLGIKWEWEWNLCVSSRQNIIKSPKPVDWQLFTIQRCRLEYFVDRGRYLLPTTHYPLLWLPTSTVQIRQSL